MACKAFGEDHEGCSVEECGSHFIVISVPSTAGVTTDRGKDHSPPTVLAADKRNAQWACVIAIVDAGSDAETTSEPGVRVDQRLALLRMLFVKTSERPRVGSRGRFVGPVRPPPVGARTQSCTSLLAWGRIGPSTFIVVDRRADALPSRPQHPIDAVAARDITASTSFPCSCFSSSPPMRSSWCAPTVTFAIGGLTVLRRFSKTLLLLAGIGVGRANLTALMVFGAMSITDASGGVDGRGPNYPHASSVPSNAFTP